MTCVRGVQLTTERSDGIVLDAPLHCLVPGWAGGRPPSWHMIWAFGSKEASRSGDIVNSNGGADIVDHGTGGRSFVRCVSTEIRQVNPTRYDSKSRRSHGRTWGTVLLPVGL